MEIVSIGHNNYIPKSKISAILQINSRPVKKLLSNAGKTDKLIDASNGKRRKSVIITTDGYVLVSSIAPKTLADRFQDNVDEE